MGNKPNRTKVEVTDAQVSTAVGNCGFKSCLSDCCIPEEKSEMELKQAAQLNEIDLAMRYGQTMGAEALLAAIKKIRDIDETGEIPDVVFIQPGCASPIVTKRTVSLRIDEHAP